MSAGAPVALSARPSRRAGADPLRAKTGRD